MNEVYVQKQDIIRRCLKRIDDIHGGDAHKWYGIVAILTIPFLDLRSISSAAV